MWKKFGKLLAIGITSIVVLAMVWSFDLTSVHIAEQIETIPGENEPTALVTVSTDWPEVYDLELTGTDVHPDQLSFAGDAVAVLDESAQIAVLVDLATRNFTRLPTLPVVTTAILAGDNKVWVYAGGIYEWSERVGEWQAITPSFELPAKVTSLARFGGNFYLLGDSLIRRVDMDGDDFVELSDWLDEGTGVGLHPDDVYLDGYLYVSDFGTITRFLRGTATGWALDAPLSGTVYLGGDGDERIFALAPALSSLYVFDDRGHLLQTVTDPLLSGAQFLGWSAAEQTVYTGVSGQIFRYQPGLALPAPDETPS